MDIEARASRFVEDRSRAPMVWGESDCSAWAAEWVFVATGQHLKMPAWNSEAEARALIARYGSLVDVWSAVIDDDNDNDLIEGYGEPEPGDVGIIHTHLVGQVGGIFLAHRNFAWRGEQGGFRLIRPRLGTIVKFWRVRCDT